MKKRAGAMTAILLVYSLLMLAMMGLTVWILSKRSTPIFIEESAPEIQEKYVYVYVKPDEDTTSTAEEEIWVVKEHESRIGIFSANGELLELLEIQTKTLPIADQGLLREGITVTNRSALYALIEDYSE